MRNVPLLEATMQQIADHPELHNQRWFITQNECGTAGCYAGWAVMLSGFNKFSLNGAEVVIGGEHHNISAVAMDLLGLNIWEALTLFDARNTRAMLELMVKDLVNGDSLDGTDSYRQETYK